MDVLIDPNSLDHPLPTDVPTLHVLVRSLQAQLKATQAELEATRAELEATRAELTEVRTRLDKLIAVTFGRKSERTPRTPPPPTGKPPSRRHEHGRSPLPEHLERRTVTHDLNDDQKSCSRCGQCRVRIGEQATEQLDCEPIHFFVRRTVRVSYACRHCEPDMLPAEERVITAGPSTVGPIPKGLPGPGLLAYTLTSKFADHIPLHRLAGMIGRSGVKVAESTLGDWVRQAATLLSPLGQLMHQRVLAASAAWSDDTRVLYQVPGQAKTSNGHLWTLIGDASAPYTLFHFSKDYSAAAGPEQFLAGFLGYLHADCLAQYDKILSAGARHVACWAHGRRKLLDAKEVATPAVEWIGQLYGIERNLPPPDTEDHIRTRGEIRRTQAIPILEQLHAWLVTMALTALPKSPMGIATGYLLPRWESFLRYTTDGRLSIDNNVSERTLRAIAVGRGNWTFLGSAEAGRWAATHFSVIGSCRHLGIDPFTYLRDVLPRLHALGDTPTVEQLTPLLPDHWLTNRASSTASPSASA